MVRLRVVMLYFIMLHIIKCIVFSNISAESNMNHGTAINQGSLQRDGNTHEGFEDPAGAAGRRGCRDWEGRVGGRETDSGGGDWFKRNVQ